MLTNALVTDSGWHLLWPNAQFWRTPSRRDPSGPPSPPSTTYY